MTNRRPLGAFLAPLFLVIASCEPADEYQDPIEGAVQELSGTFMLKAASSGKCWDVPGSNANRGTILDQWSCHTATNQQWQVKQVSSGIHQLTSAASGLCADVSGASTDDGAKIIQWTCGASKTNQQWRLLSMGGGVYRLRSVKSGKCVAVAGNSSADGAQLEQQPCSSSAKNQQFAFSGAAGGGGGSGGSPGTGGGPGTNPGTGGSSGGGNLVWKKANLTNFTSYPDPGSEECIKFNGCMWAGQFAFVSGTQSKSWVMSHNIAAIHEKDANTYKLKTLRLKQGSKQIDVVVYDECADSDCSGCCTENARQNGLNFLIDIESFTMDRFGTGDGVVDWACLNCN
jgi:hypothetical protein